MNESLADTVLAALDADSVLRAAQTLLQKMKIALDRVASDLNSADGDGDMVDNFLQSRDFVNALLYEVVRTMTEFQVISGAQESCWGNFSEAFIYSHFQIHSQPAVPSDFMPASVMSTDQPAMRDWFLYRDKIKHYYCEKIWSHLKRKRENEMLRIGNEYFLESLYWARN